MGILDEIMDGIKEKPETTQQAAPAPQAGPGKEDVEKEQADTDKSMHGYSDQFKKQYGDKKK